MNVNILSPRMPSRGTPSPGAIRSPSARLKGPDLLRVLAILLVMLLHTRGEAAPGVLSTVRPYAWLVVDIFFVLSGYLIGTQLIARAAAHRPVSLAKFYLNRAFRILPAYIIVLAVYFVVPTIREAPDLHPCGDTSPSRSTLASTTPAPLPMLGRSVSKSISIYYFL